MRCFAQENVFSFHLFGEPYSLDSATVGGPAGSYLFSNIFRGLYRYSNNTLIPEGAKDCVMKNQKLYCDLDPKRKWSNGQKITAENYVTTFRRLFDPQIKSQTRDLLLHLKNSRAILNGTKPKEDLGVVAKDQKTLVFEFDQPDPDFLFKLTHPALSPTFSTKVLGRDQVSELIVSGPYKIETWEKGKKIRLIPNKYYPRKTTPPKVDIFFIDDDQTALRLYESGKINFLRRVSLQDISVLKNRKDFFEQPTARFDYIGFGPQLKNHFYLRKALSLALDYDQARELMHTQGQPGCPSLSSNYFATYPCYKFNLVEAKKALKQVDPKLLKQKWTIYFSKMGGESHQIVFEWVQDQWKKNLNLDISLVAQEQVVVTQTIKSGKAEIFRRGVALDRPTCLAGLEVFQKENPENLIHFENQPYDSLVQSQPKTVFGKRQRCTNAFQLLLEDYALIPMGVVSFSYLARPNFTGFTINELNQLDLTDLRSR